MSKVPVKFGVNEWYVRKAAENSFLIFTDGIGPIG